MRPLLGSVVLCVALAACSPSAPDKITFDESELTYVDTLRMQGVTWWILGDSPAAGVGHQTEQVGILFTEKRNPEQLLSWLVGLMEKGPTKIMGKTGDETTACMAYRDPAGLYLSTITCGAYKGTGARCLTHDVIATEIFERCPGKAGACIVEEAQDLCRRDAEETQDMLDQLATILKL